MAQRVKACVDIRAEVPLRKLCLLVSGAWKLLGIHIDMYVNRFIFQYEDKCNRLFIYD